jgi:anthranilate phosphoribosyltransferase
MHPAMRHVGPVRRELGLPTVMNVVGPLANPAGAGKQVLGVAEANRLPLLAGALASLGSRHALVVHGEPGMDEVSPLGPTRVLEIREGRITSWEIDPAEFGYRSLSAADLGGGTPGDNARIIVEVLEGRGNAAATAAVVLNAAAALYVAGLTADYNSGVETARQAVSAGAGIAALDRMRAAYAAAGN